MASSTVWNFLPTRRPVPSWVSVNWPSFESLDPGSRWTKRSRSRPSTGTDLVVPSVSFTVAVPPAPGMPRLGVGRGCAGAPRLLGTGASGGRSGTGAGRTLAWMPMAARRSSSRSPVAVARICRISTPSSRASSSSVFGDVWRLSTIRLASVCRDAASSLRSLKPSVAFFSARYASPRPARSAAASTEKPAPYFRAARSEPRSSQPFTFSTVWPSAWILIARV